MGNWIIYDKNGNPKHWYSADLDDEGNIVRQDTLELHDEWMGECFLTVNIRNAEPIDFAVGDYIDYRGERFTINYDPTVLKKARRGTYGEGFTYDNIKFVNEAQAKVVMCDFTDIVLDDNQMHYTSLPTFPFYCESVDDLLDRVQACLEELYPGEFTLIGLNTVRNAQRGLAVGRQQAFIHAYKQYVDPSGEERTDPYGKLSVALTVDNINCWEAVTKIHSDFALNFIQHGSVIIAGMAGVFTANTFRYGKGNGLYEIERIGESDQQIITRLRAYGSDQNLPQHYYANLNTQVFAHISNVQKFTTQGCSFTLDLDFNTKYFTYRSESYPGTAETPNYIVEIKANDISVRGYVSKYYASNQCYIYCEYTGGSDDDRDEPDAAKMAAFVTAISNGDRVDFVDYVNKDTFDSTHKDSATENLPDNMAVSRLMLPGFPNQSLYDWVEEHKNDEDKQWLRDAIADGFTFSTEQYRPYIDSPNVSLYGVRPSSIYFDGSNETDDIHPSIEGMEFDGIAVDKVVSAEQVDDNGVFPADTETKIPNIHIYLPNLGFDLSKVYQDGATIDMKNGMCGARSFKIAGIPKMDELGHWALEVQREHDESLDLWFPYKDFQVSSGDNYVLTGITFPSAYVDAAAIKLLRQSIEELKKNHATRYTYQPRIDEIWMQRQHDIAMSSEGVVSLHDTLKAGDVFRFADVDMGIDASIIIDVLTIKENGNNGIPTYEVTLRDEKQVGTIQKIQNKVDSIFSEGINGAGGGGLTESQIASLINSVGSDQFLSKQHDDTGKGNYTFENDVNIKGNINGVVAVLDKILSSEYTGDGMNDTGFLLQYANGRAKLVIDDLVARGKFTFNELESRIWTYAGGNMIFSGAGSKIFFVEYLDADGHSLGYTNINAPWLLAGRPLLASMVAWSKRRSVKRSLTDAEIAQVVTFRCYEYSDNGTMQTRNWWHQDDLAFCQTLNHVKDKANSDGSYSGAASNSVYHRRVVSIGSKTIDALNDGRIYDYVDLSNVSGEYDPTYNDWPAAGDTIVQRGNYSDSTRRSMVTIEVTGDTRGLKVYDNIMGWYANTQQGEKPNGERYIFIGYNENTGRAKLEVLGDSYIGDPNGSTYIKYDMEDATTHRPKLRVKAEVEFTNPDEEMDEWVRGHQKKYDNEIANLESITEDLQKQIDGAIESYFMVGVPSLTTPPVMNTAQTHYEDAWLDGTETQEERIAILNKHVGDLYYDKATGHGYRFLYDDDTSTHMWTVLTDEDVTEALRIASEAQETADGKMTVYSTWNAWMKNNVNTLQYGDLFIPSSTTTQSGVTYEAGKAYKCISDGQSIFSELAYTDDTYAHNFDYLKEAMKGDTKILGGLVLSHTLVMRNTDVETSVMAGINGVLNTDLTDPLMSIAAWYGGGMVDLEHLSDYWTAQQIAEWEALTPAQKAASLAVAKSLDRQDGSGYRACGNLSWDKDGNLNIQGNKIKAANYYLNGDDITAQLSAILKMFDLEGEGTATSPYVIKAKYSLYSVGDVSAFGHSSQGGGGGGASTLSELHDVNISGLSDGQMLVYDLATTHWVNRNIPETYVLPTASASALGGIKVGYTTSGKNYKVQLDSSNNAYVNVPWTDTTYSAGTGISLSGTTFSNSGVRSATINGNYLRVNTNGTNADLTIPYATSATSATKLATARTINGTSFDGTANITTANWGTARNISIADSDSTNTGSAVSVNGSANATLKLPATIKATLSGNASSATKLATARTIWGQSFDGSTNISGAITGATTISASSNVTVGGTLGVTGATTLTGLLTANGGITIPSGKTLKIGDAELSWDSTNQGIKVTKGLYSETFISALGSGSSGGGGGGASVLYELNDVKPDSDITPTKVYGAQTGAVLTYGSDGKWYASMPSEGITTLANLTDVSIPNPTNGQVLMYDTSGSTPQWVAGNIPESASWGTVGTDSVQLTIGSATKTLLTSHQSLSGYATQQWVENKGYLTSIPAATSSALGGIKIGYTQSGKNYPVQLSSEKAYVNVPWENTTYSAGTGISLSGTTFSIKSLSSGAWFDGTTYVGSDGVMEVGRYIDFHPTSASTLDYNVRLDAGTNTNQWTFTFPDIGGTLLCSGNSSVSKSGETLTVKINGISQSLTNTNTTYTNGTGLSLSGTTFAISSTYQTYITNGNTAYGWGNHASAGYAKSSALSSYLPLSGGTMTGTLTLRSDAYGGPTGTHGLNCKNSDIVNVNSIYTNDTSDGWEEGILFKRTNGNWDSFRALDGTFYFHANSGGGRDVRISQEDLSQRQLFIGSVSNNGWVRVQDICSQSGDYGSDSIWSIRQNGAAHFQSVYSYGDVTALSDARHKQVIGNIPLTVEQIAKMPAVRYRWIDRDDNDDTHVGTLAQSWQEVLPQVVREDNDTLSMNYSAAALVSSIIIARKTVSNEQRIKELEKECERLRKELEKLKIA